MQSGQLQILMYILVTIKLWVPASSKNPAIMKYIGIGLVRKQSPVTVAQTHGQKNMIAPSQVIVVPLRCYCDSNVQCNDLICDSCLFVFISLASLIL